MSAQSSHRTPEGPGSVSGAPNFPAGFTDTLKGRYIDAGTLRLAAGRRRACDKGDPHEGA